MWSEVSYRDVISSKVSSSLQLLTCSKTNLKRGARRHEGGNWAISENVAFYNKTVRACQRFPRMSLLSTTDKVEWRLCEMQNVVFDWWDEPTGFCPRHDMRSIMWGRCGLTRVRVPKVLHCRCCCVWGFIRAKIFRGILIVCPQHKFDVSVQILGTIHIGCHLSPLAIYTHRHTFLYCRCL